MVLCLEERRYTSPEAIVVRAYDTQTGVLAGRISFYENAALGQITNFEVAKTYRGKGGAATSLFRHAEQRLVTLGFKIAALHVVETNLRARAFYERQGRRMPKRRHPVPKIVRYEKSLTQEHG